MTCSENFHVAKKFKFIFLIPCPCYIMDLQQSVDEVQETRQDNVSKVIFVFYSDFSKQSRLNKYTLKKS